MTTSPPPIPYASPRPQSFWRRWRLPLLILASVGAALAAVVVGLGIVGFMLFDMGTEQSSLTQAEIESILAVKLPASAQGFQSHYVSWQDFFLRTTFTIDPGDAAALATSMGIALPLSDEKVPLMLDASHPQLPWWTPGQASQYLAGSSEATLSTTQPSIYYHLLIDTSDPSKYTVWLVAHDT